jgi:uncharacterized damage-inducible protein DinB
MNREDILDLYRYNAWASGRIFAAARPLPPEALNRDLGSSFRSIRDTLAHMVGSEWVWFERWTGPSPASPPDWIASSGLEELAVKLGDLEARRRDFLSALDDAELERARPFKLFSGRAGEAPLRDLLVHLANHSTYHRGQVVTMLRQVGAAAPSTDYLIFRLSWD